MWYGKRACGIPRFASLWSSPAASNLCCSDQLFEWSNSPYEELPKMELPTPRVLPSAFRREHLHASGRAHFDSAADSLALFPQRLYTHRRTEPHTSHEQL